MARCCVQLVNVQIGQTQLRDRTVTYKTLGRPTEAHTQQNVRPADSERHCVIRLAHVRGWFSRYQLGDSVDVALLSQENGYAGYATIGTLSSF